MADSTNAQHGSGVRTYFYVGSPPAWTLLPNVRHEGALGADSPEVDSTDLASAARQRIPGLPDGKEMTFVGVGNVAMDALLRANYNIGVNVDVKIDFPSPFGLDFYFTFTPLGWEFPDIAPDVLVEQSLRGRISGAISNTVSH